MEQGWVFRNLTGLSRLAELLIVAAVAATGPVVAGAFWLRSEVNKQIEADKKEVTDQIRAILPAGAIIMVRSADCPSGWVLIGKISLSLANEREATACQVVPRPR